jgi:Rrf2 family cysteine metabolism transcriptional repressor
MRISTRARYGVRFMIELAVRQDKGPVYLKDIARAGQMSEKYLSQLVLPLRSAGLVNTFRGAKGGYVLGKNVSEIPWPISLRQWKAI